ncbi:MAG: M56 family metallopeptidase [Chthoniobacteraceae bacterium]
MNTLHSLFQQPAFHRAGWVLVHFLWQGLGIALLLAVALRLSARASSHFRYLVICGGLLLCGIAPVITWTLLDHQAAPFRLSPESAQVSGGTAIIPNESRIATVPAMQNPGPSATAKAATPWRLNRLQKLDDLLPYTVAIWFAGVLILTLRLILGGMQLQRLRRSGVTIPDPAWQEKFRDLVQRMRISPPVRLLQSALVEVPTLIGWLRPVILIPASAFTGLTTSQLESILAHELAHVRRCDYLVNLFQTAVETLLFYNPAVWWISRKLREERENCCDDIAVETIRDRAIYASALATLEEARRLSPALAVAATGGLLLQRIRRIAGVDHPPATSWTLWVLILGFFVASCLAHTKAGAPPETPPQPVRTYLQVTYIETETPLRQQGTFHKGFPEHLAKNPKNKIVKLNSFPLKAGMNTFEGSAPRGIKFKITTDWHDTPGDKPHTIDIKEEWADTNNATGIEMKPPVLTKDYYLLPAPSEKIANSNLLIGFFTPSDALLKAIDDNSITSVKELLNQGADPNTAGEWSPNDREFPLDLAAMRGHSAIVKLLLDRGATSKRALILALHNGNADSVKYCWDHGMRSVSELCYAVSQGASVSDLQKMLDQGHAINSPEDHAITSLCQAVKLRRMDLVEFLVQHGADVNKGGVAEPGWPDFVLAPLPLAASEGEDEMVDYLLKHGATDTFYALYQAAYESRAYEIGESTRSQEHYDRAANLLIDAGALKKINQQQTGIILSTSMESATGKGNAVVLKMLLDAGLSARTPIPMALSNGKKATVIDFYSDRYRQYEKSGKSFEIKQAPDLKQMLDLLEKADANSKPGPAGTQQPLPEQQPSKTSQDTVTKPETYSERILSAARAEDGSLIQKVITEPRPASYAPSNLLNADTSLPDPFANGRPVRIDGVRVRLDFLIGPVHMDYGMPRPNFNDHLDAPGPGYRERKTQPSIKDWNIPPKSQA